MEEEQGERRLKDEEIERGDERGRERDTIVRKRGEVNSEEEKEERKREKEANILTNN